LPLAHVVEEHILPCTSDARPGGVRGSWFKDYYAVVSPLRAMHTHCKQCAEEIQRKDFDLLLAAPCRFFGTSPIARYLRIPSVIYLQEPYRQLYEALPRLPWAAPSFGRQLWRSPRQLWRFIGDLIQLHGKRVQVREERANAAAFDMILVNSLFSRESVLRAYGLPAKVCYLGIDTDVFRPSGERREGYIVGLGGISLHKGIERAIPAIGTLPRTLRPDLLWIGNFTDLGYQRRMETLADEHGVNVRFEVRVTDRELIGVLSRAVAMIYTSRLEPFGLAPLEANACGTPVVAIAEGGVRETITDELNGLLVDDDDPVALGNAIRRLVENRKLARELGRRGRREVVRKWSAESAVDRLEGHIFQCAMGLKGRDDSSC